MGFNPPYYCKKTYFIQADAKLQRWYSRDLQNPDEVGDPNSKEINSACCVVHYVGALVFGAALSNLDCSLGPDARLGILPLQLANLESDLHLVRIGSDFRWAMDQSANGKGTRLGLIFQFSMADPKGIDLVPNSNLTDGKVLRNRKVLVACCAGAAVLIAGIGILSSAQHVQTSNNKATEILRSLSQAHAIQISVTATGNLVELGHEQRYSIYALPRGQSSYDLWMNSQAPDGTEFNLTVKDNRGFYSFQENETLLTQCLQPKQIMPLAEIAQSIMDATVIHDEAAKTGDYGCENGTLIAGVWAARKFVYCVDESDRVTSLVSPNLMVYVHYLSEDQVQEVETLLLATSKETCPELDMGQDALTRKLSTSLELPENGHWESMERANFGYAGIASDETYAAFSSFVTNETEFPSFVTLPTTETNYVCTYPGSDAAAMVMEAAIDKEQSSISLSSYTKPVLTKPGANLTEYVGCYKDHRIERLFYSRMPRYSRQEHNPRSCADRCFARKKYSEYFAVNRLDCFCGYSWTNLERHGPPRESMCNHKCYDGSGQTCGGHYELSVYAFSKYLDPKLLNLPTKRYNLPELDTLMYPRNCVWIHGDGFSTQSTELKLNYYEAFGSMGFNPPCYCKKTYFIQADTKTQRWHNRDLQKHLCAMVRKADEGGNPNSTEINSAVVFAHYTGALAFGAALANLDCSLGNDARLVTIQAPVDGISLPKSNDQVQSLCQQIEPIQERIAKAKLAWAQSLTPDKIKLLNDKYGSGRVRQASSKNEDWTILFPNQTECKSSWGQEREEVWEALRPPNEMKDPEMAAQLKAAAQALGDNVDGSVCGVSPTGSVSQASGFSNINTLTLFGEMPSGDKIVPLESCTDLSQYLKKSLKKRRRWRERFRSRHSRKLQASYVNYDFKYQMDQTQVDVNPFRMSDTSFTDVKTDTDSFVGGSIATGLSSLGGSFADIDVSGFMA